MKRLGHVSALDGVRGLAIASVVGFHYYGKPEAGFLGVELFFVLSGFLITTLLLQERADKGRVSLRAFYLRRARRLLPAMFGLLAVATLMAVLRPDIARELGIKHIELLGGALYFENFVVSLHAPTFPNPIMHLWSLAEEEQFYLVWPVLLLVVLRDTAPRRLVVGLAGATAALACWRAGLVMHGASGYRIAYAPDTRADPLALGCLLGVARFHQLIPTSVTRRAGILGAAGLIVFAWLAFTVRGWATDEWGLPLASVAAAAMIYAAVEAPSARVTRLFAWKPLMKLGVISYGLYIWHPLVARFVPVASLVVRVPAALLAVPLALLVAWGSYHLIEQPFRRPRSRPETTEIPAPPERGDAGMTAVLARPTSQAGG